MNKRKKGDEKMGIKKNQQMIKFKYNYINSHIICKLPHGKAEIVTLKKETQEYAA